MLRQIINPALKEVVLSLPDEMVGKPVEVVAFTLNNVEVSREETRLKVSAEQFREMLKNASFSADGWKFDRNEANDYD